jgi:four helix bundle protein
MSHRFNISFLHLENIINMAKNDLEERLIQFAVSIIWIAETMKRTYAGNHLSEQITRSSTSAALNYGEAESAESRRDFIHKMQVVLKELRETYVNLRITLGANLNPNVEKLNEMINENNELISIFVTSIQTARKNLANKK